MEAKHGPNEPPLPFTPLAGATFSLDRKQRYALWRKFGWGTKTVTFICMNPSTADAETDDHTVHRMIGFAKKWGYDHLNVVNVLPYVTSEAATAKRMALTVLLGDTDQGNQEIAVWVAMDKAETVVLAWGAALPLEMQRQFLEAMCVKLDGKKLWCLGMTKHGRPRHPLMVRKDAKLVPFNLIRAMARRDSELTSPPPGLA
jgi:hypothetical protein